MKLSHVRPARLFIRFASFIRRHLILLLVSVFLFILGFLGVLGVNFLSRLHIKPQDLLSFLGSPQESLDSTNGVTNFLILGIRGEGTDSPNLADTIIVLSYDHSTKTPTMVSVPRDLWVPSIQAKINAAFYYGEQKVPSAGIQMAEGAVLEDLGIPIHYTAIVNFTIFKETIDLLGGIDVNINPGFSDTEFPILGMENAMPESARFETVTFATGSAHMNGETTLKFVRSRHATGDEGTDFARSKRQQQVISALRQKMLTPAFLLDKNKLDAFFVILNRNLKTNINQNLYPTLAKVALDARNNPVHSVTFSDQPDENGLTILYTPPTRQYKGEWVLMPKDNNWSALKKYLDNLLKGKQ
ncbi:LytR family transcriptional regulator [bacterium]|nr:MAG: LytR family transcriptional regulator [bacterium]